MAGTTDRYLLEATHRIVVDALAEDGALCDYITKVYDEIGTCNGGTGHRQAFTRYNDRVNLYHRLLRDLTGERRANIYESIPVIDFLNRKNTSLSSTYVKINGGDTPIDSTVVDDTSLDRTKTALQLIREEDPHTVNRAILGYNTAEQFYNTTSNNGSSFNVLVSPYSGDTACLYKGVYLPYTYNTDRERDVRKSDILYYRVSSSDRFSFKPDNDSDEFMNFSTATTSSGAYLVDRYGTKVLNTACGRDKDRKGNPLSNAGAFEKTGGGSLIYDQNSKWYFSVSENDILLVFPTSIYSSVPNRILYLQAVNPQTVTEQTEGIVGDLTGTTTFTPVGTEYNAYNATAYYVDRTSGNVYRYDPEEGRYYIDEDAKTVGSVENPTTTVEVTDLVCQYIRRLLLIENFESDFNSSFSLTEIPYGTEMPAALKASGVEELLSPYIKVEKEYYAEASGLLDGCFCEPVEWTSMGSSRTVTKWRFCNDKEKAAEHGVDIDVGAEYDPAHILGRGNMIDSPLALTPHDQVTVNGRTVSGIGSLKEAGFNGKAQVYYNNLVEHGVSIDKIFKPCTMSFETWRKRNTSTPEIRSVITNDDMAGSTSKAMAYPKKLLSGSSPVTCDEIISYAKAFSGCRATKSYPLGKSEENNVLVLNSSNDRILISRDEKRRKHWIISNDTTTVTTQPSRERELRENPRTMVYLKYDYIYKKNSDEAYSELSNVRLKMISPLDLFRTEGSSPDTVLVYPEYSGYYPDTMVLLSRNKLNLEKYSSSAAKDNMGTCFLYSEGRYLMFSVTEAYDCTMDNIVGIQLSDDKGTRSTWTIKGLFDDNWGRSGCWVYKLAPLRMSLDRIEIFDADDRPIDLNDLEDNAPVTGASYPKEYFKVEKTSSSDSIRYKVVSEDPRKDLTSLIGARIITGVPDFTAYAATNKASGFLKYWLPVITLQPMLRRFVTVFSTMLSDSESFMKTALKGIMYSLLGDWKISDSTSNPILLKDAGGLASSLKDFALGMSNMISKSGFYAIVNGEKTLLGKEHFSGLLARVGATGKYMPRIYRAVRTKNPSMDMLFERTTGPVPTENAPVYYTRTEGGGYAVADPQPEVGTDVSAYYRRAYLKFEPMLEDTVMTADDRNDYYMPKGEVFSVCDPDDFEKKGPLPGTSLKGYYKNVETRDLLKAVYKGCFEIQESSSDEEKTLFSYDHIARLIRTAFEGDGLSKEDCKELDECFGNDTDPIFTLGEELGGYDVPSPIKNLAGRIVQEITSLTYEALGCLRQADPSVPTIDRTRLEDYFYTVSTAYNDSTTIDLQPDDHNEKLRLLINPPSVTEGGLLAKGYLSLDAAGNDAVAEVTTTPLSPTVSEDALWGVADFIKTSLEGTDPDGEQGYYVKCLPEDSSPSGRKNSLYYKRYVALNTRVNRLQGPLYRAALLMNNMKVTDDSAALSRNMIESYNGYIDVLPVADMEKMTYLPPQKASSTTIPLEGKYYSDKEMDALRTQIGSSCVLTCTSCKIKDSCPFYSQDEVIKLYCTGLETIDLWFKDNELELLDTASFEIEPEGDGNGFDFAELRKRHLPYSDIVKKLSDGQTLDYDVNDLNDVRETLKARNSQSGLDLRYTDYVQDDMGWLLGGRYGTVERNASKDVSTTADYDDRKDFISDYRYLYDALFIDVKGKDSNKDDDVLFYEDDSYIDYGVSSNTYDIGFEVGPSGAKRRYTGRTKIKIPHGLKMLDKAGKQDDVYLVSDDTLDSEGLQMVPVVYLGRVGDLQYTFDLRDDGIPKGSVSPSDPNIYAADVAKWCANYYKGCLADDPIGNNGDGYSGRDQYWMESVYKKINGVWCEFPGRPRRTTDYQEAVMDPENIDEMLIVSGHPFVNTYVDFVRKMSIRMYDPQTEEWLVPFVNPNMDLPWPDRTYRENVEIQRKALTLMKTNLRLTLVKKGGN